MINFFEGVSAEFSVEFERTVFAPLHMALLGPPSEDWLGASVVVLLIVGALLLSNRSYRFLNLKVAFILKIILCTISFVFVIILVRLVATLAVEIVFIQVFQAYLNSHPSAFGQGF
jgi:hypothetical protein